MSEDINKIYTELEESIKKEDHAQCLNLSSKILASNPKDAEAIKTKIVALINLGKSKEIISFIESQSNKGEYALEYAYALYDNKQYKESIEYLDKNKSAIQPNKVNILLAQNYHKLNDFTKSYESYKKAIEALGDEIENDLDLLSNFLAEFGLSHSQDFDYLKSLQKYINSWECFYNYTIIFLLNDKFNDCLTTIKRAKEEFPNVEDEGYKLKDLHLNLYLLQNLFEGFEINKYTSVGEDFAKTLETEIKNKEFYPYFYNNMLNYKKDKDTHNEIIRKIDGFLKQENLNEKEKNIIQKNKLNILIRANKLQEASELLNTIFNANDGDLVIAKTYLYFKNEKEKYEELIKNDSTINSTPECQLALIQLMLSSLNIKLYEQFHLKVLNFISKFHSFCMNYHFISFFIGFYNSKKLTDYLKEFLKNFKNPTELGESIKDKNDLKNVILKIASSFYSVGQYEDSVKFYTYYVENISSEDKEIKGLLVQNLAHVDLSKSDEIRRSIDETPIDLSNEHMNNLLNELFSKFKRPTQQNKEKKKKKKKIRYPKNFDPKNPGPMPDPERWLPKLQRKKYRNLAKNKMAYQGASADNKTTTTSKFK